MYWLGGRISRQDAATRDYGVYFSIVNQKMGVREKRQNEIVLTGVIFLSIITGVRKKVNSFLFQPVNQTHLFFFDTSQGPSV
jgi:hypothetical protein